MAKTTDTTTPTLPTLATVSADELPKRAIGARTLTDDERAYASDLNARLAAGGIVKADGFATLDAAKSSMRLVKSIVTSAALPLPDGNVVRFSTGASGSGFAWFARAGTPSKAGRKASDPEEPSR